MQKEMPIFFALSSESTFLRLADAHISAASANRRLPKVRLSEQNTKYYLSIFVGFHPTFSRHAIADASIALVIWLNENVGFHPTFSRHAIADASIALVIWLNENVRYR